ncbi:CotH kinase family protein [Aristaeella lactis]|uniref:CotH protein n=1 Tax=Aristaeella lactis TaxID=3046383 RepID=A0AC61PQL0_9FIRM|nr:CotH kinase family protein [Aristaeella lactis]QUA52347.1 CotH kinase family protein [Aristaeella lactis]SMC91674.1 CotH protein [Aristaeella lactis]
MHESKAQERIHEAVRDSLSWLDELPSRETEILEQTKKEAEPLITIYNGTCETRIEPAYTPAVNRNPSVRFRSLAAIAAVLVLLTGLWTIRLNRSDSLPLDTVTQPIGTEAAPGTPGQDSPKFPAAVSLQDENQSPSLDRIDLYVEEDLLWNKETGILAEGDNVDKSKGIPFQNTVYRQVARAGGSAEGKLEYRNGQGSLLFTDDISLQLDPEDTFSMDMPQKSFLLKASDGSFDYPLFDDRTADAYPTILLRNGGNDSMWTRVMDEVQHRLIERHTDARLLTQAWRPVNVYLNGEYWGIYNMRENVDAYTVCRYEQIPDDLADDITILYINGTPLQGQKKNFVSMREQIKNSDPAHNPEDLAYLEQEIDIDSFLDWLTVEMYFGNSDIGNGMVYRVPGGKWKCLIQDLDYGLFSSGFNSVESYLKEKGMGEVAIDNSIFLKILEVDKYRELFFTKLGSLFHSLTTEVMLAELDECVEWIEPSMQAHFDRWGPLNDKAIISELPTTSEGAWQYWQQRIKRLRKTMLKRPILLYGYIQEFFGMSDTEMAVYFPTDIPKELPDSAT